MTNSPSASALTSSNGVPASSSTAPSSTAPSSTGPSSAMANKARSSFSSDPRFYFPHFQPVVDIPSGRIIGYESLIRTHSRDGDVVTAGHLFDDELMADEDRLNIDRAVRIKALRRFANDPDGGMLFINISPQWAMKLGETSTTPTLKMIREVGIDPSRVVLEITEKSGDVASLEALVNNYRREGVKIAIDDFGVGGSQVDRLIALKPDFLKIDMGIFKDASRNGASAKVLLALSALSEQAQFEIICEGVESEEEFHFAIECGAQKIQGWLFGRADGPLLEPNITKDAVAFLQTMYLDRKKNIVLKSSERNNRIKKYIELIYDYFVHDRTHTLDANLFHQAGLLRFYICDLKGKQVSPNSNFLADGLSLDYQYVGCYWSHRPYFPVAVGLKGMIKRQQIVSRNYVDGPTKQLCKTTAIPLEEDRILLVDSLAFDDVLYCTRSD